MTGRAVVAERRRAARERKTQELRIGFDGRKVACGDLVAEGGLLFVRGGQVFGHPFTLAVGEIAPGIA